jgi:uncharacterized integral membrane protein
MGSVPTTFEYIICATLLAVILNIMSHNIYLKLLRWFSYWPVIVEACPSEVGGGHTEFKQILI